MAGVFEGIHVFFFRSSGDSQHRRAPLLAVLDMLYVTRNTVWFANRCYSSRCRHVVCVVVTLAAGGTRCFAVDGIERLVATRT